MYSFLLSVRKAGVSVRKTKTGCVHIYTGDGKGKTTASLGLGIRAAASGLCVCMFQFLKTKGSSSENWLQFPNFRVICLDQTHPMFQKSEARKQKSEDDLKNNILKEIGKIKRVMKSGKYDLVILDELINCVSEGFVNEEDVLRLIKARPKSVELVLTGRKAPKALTDVADYVTDMKKTKHPFDAGLKCRKGIEY